MQTYIKIETLYKRDITGTKKLIYGDYRNETVAFLANSVDWIFTEKIDGTNIRVHWDGHKVEFGGRTDKAAIPAKLMNYLNEKFKTNEAEELFEQMFGEKEVIFFGEGYGAGIQKGGNYIPDHQEFIMFDVMISDNYQPRETVEQMAEAFGVEVVPIIGCGPLSEAEEYVMRHPVSMYGHADMEGLVCRPKVELCDRCGNRIIVKIKWEDYKEFVKNDTKGDS